MGTTIIVVEQVPQCPQCGSHNLKLSDQRGLKGLLDWSIIVWREGVYLVCNDCGWRDFLHD